MIPSDFRQDILCRKTRVPSCSVIFVVLYLATLTQRRLVTDRQTDRQTGPQRKASGDERTQSVKRSLEGTMGSSALDWERLMEHVRL